MITLYQFAHERGEIGQPPEIDGHNVPSEDTNVPEVDKVQWAHRISDKEGRFAQASAGSALKVVPSEVDGEPISVLPCFRPVLRVCLEHLRCEGIAVGSRMWLQHSTCGEPTAHRVQEGLVLRRGTFEKPNAMVVSCNKLELALVERPVQQVHT